MHHADQVVADGVEVDGVPHPGGERWTPVTVAADSDVVWLVAEHGWGCGGIFFKVLGSHPMTVRVDLPA